MSNKVYHVSIDGCDSWEGTRQRPLRTISRAARLAQPGDTVTVHEGEYREWVKPEQGGLSDSCRIVYQAAPGERVVIKGSETVSGWEPLGEQVWKVTIPNCIFGNFNPYHETLGGDWFLYPDCGTLHRGEVYVNGRSLYEAGSLEEVRNPHPRTQCPYPIWWQEFKRPIPNRDQTLYQWYCETNEEYTTIYANFQGTDPNCAQTEINVRPCCFYPEKEGLNYITVRGFEMAHAATAWAPPTGNQTGMTGPHWGKGWIIENNILHDSKCCAISIGRDGRFGDNLFTNTRRKSGHRYQSEAVFRALQMGWSRESVGSHIIRNNEIYNCGQCGIVGHLGCVFSEISGNHIHHIAMKQEFFGHEIAGIKLHAAIDVSIHRNNIHDCTLGTWLDWEAQGARVSKNLYYNNERDLMVEVTHGPCLVDNNIFASGYNLENAAQGGAYINNLFTGIIHRYSVTDRATPYHFPHSTQIAGYSCVLGGDDRLYNNVFTAKPSGNPKHTSGTVSYDGAPDSGDLFCKNIREERDRCGDGDFDLYLRCPQPAFIDHNCYFNGARHFDKELHPFMGTLDPGILISEADDGTYLEWNVEKELVKIPATRCSTESLGVVRIPDASYEAPDGGPVSLDTDYFDLPRQYGCPVGPIADIQPGFNRIRVWNKGKL